MANLATATGWKLPSDERERLLRRFPPKYENVIAGIREIDSATPVWWEPQVIDDGGAGNSVGLLSPIADPAANLRFLIFPALTLGVGMAAVIMRTTRSAMLDVLGADYIRTAHAKGLVAVRVIERHALKNGLIVVMTILGIQVGYLLGGAVVVEEVFSLPGIGRMLQDLHGLPTPEAHRAVSTAV